MSTKRLVLVSVALGVLVLVVVPLPAALRADPAVLADEEYLGPACKVPFQAFPEPSALASWREVARHGTPRADRRAAARASSHAAEADRHLDRELGLRRLQIVAPFAFVTFPSASSGRTPAPFEADPGCGLVSCGLDHTLFHLLQVLFLLAMAFDGYRLQRALPERGTSA